MLSKESFAPLADLSGAFSQFQFSRLSLPPALAKFPAWGPHSGSRRGVPFFLAQCPSWWPKFFHPRAGPPAPGEGCQATLCHCPQQHLLFWRAKAPSRSAGPAYRCCAVAFATAYLALSGPSGPVAHPPRELLVTPHPSGGRRPPPQARRRFFRTLGNLLTLAGPSPQTLSAFLALRDPSARTELGLGEGVSWLPS